MDRQAEIFDLLYRLGATANYTGFFHTAYAVRLCAEEPQRLLLVTKWVYPDVARQYQTTWKAVERNIRTVGAVIWRQNRPLLEQLARRPLAERPCSAQLLSILSAQFSPPARAAALSNGDCSAGVDLHPSNGHGWAMPHSVK